MADTAQRVAEALLAIHAVGFRPADPMTFKSGIISPVYVDNRKFPFHPQAWKTVIEGFAERIREDAIAFDALAGIETAGIPHSAALGYALRVPSVFIRKQVKDHGTKSRIEGGSVAGKTVLLIEDLVTLGGSSLSGVAALRDEGAAIHDCMVIISYGFRESADAFAQANVRLHALTSFPVVLDLARQQGRFSAKELSVIEDWFFDPHGWASRHGFSPPA